MHGLFYASFSILNMCGMYVGLFFTQITIWSMSGICLEIWTNMAICPTVISGLIFTTDDVAHEPS